MPLSLFTYTHTHACNFIKVKIRTSVFNYWGSDSKKDNFTEDREFMLRSCQFPVKFRTQGSFLPSLFTSNPVHFSTEEEVAVYEFFPKSDKQQIGAHTAEADTQTRAHAHTERTSAWLVTEHSVNSTQIGTNCSHVNMSTEAQGCSSFQCVRTMGHWWMDAQVLSPQPI